MERNQIKEIIQSQRDYFNSCKTMNVDTRIENLKKLKQTIIDNESKINEALQLDLGKSATESFMCEIGMVLSEISHMIKHVRKYAKKKRVHTPLAQFHASSYQVACPYGVVLVMSPWNYPFMLSLDPLVDALAAGNTVIVKPSAYSPNTSKVIEEILSLVFPKEYVCVIQGGRKENQALLEEKFDYIFFTGSPTVGHEVMAKASVHLTPVTLELGGKSPCIVDETANIKLAARRIVFGKYLNLGQTCVAPDYIYVHKSIQDKLVNEIINEIKIQYSDLSNYGKIINEKHFDRLCRLIDDETVCLLTRKNVKSYAYVDVNTDELDIGRSKNKATYKEIMSFVEEKYGFKVSALYIAGVKDELGLEKQFSYEDNGMAAKKRPNCPKEKHDAIVDALVHFGIISAEKSSTQK